jgi:hypothetical protein
LKAKNASFLKNHAKGILQKKKRRFKKNPKHRLKNKKRKFLKKNMQKIFAKKNTAKKSAQQKNPKRRFESKNREPVRKQKFAAEKKNLSFTFFLIILSCNVKSTLIFLSRFFSWHNISFRRK